MESQRFARLEDRRANGAGKALRLGFLFWNPRCSVHHPEQELRALVGTFPEWVQLFRVDSKMCGQVVPIVEHLPAHRTLVLGWPVQNHVLLQFVRPGAADFARKSWRGSGPAADGFVRALGGQAGEDLATSFEGAREGICCEKEI